MPPADGRYVTGVRFTRACRSFAAGIQVEFRSPITLLVGEQGAGKSTLLAAIRRYGIGHPPLPDDLDADLEGAVALEGPLGCVVRLVDLERANPRMRPLEDPFDLAQMDRVLHALHARRHSHGEALLPLLDQLAGLPAGLLLLDTPETALSIHHQYRLAAILARAAARGVQVIAATHSAILISSQPQVLDLTEGQWVASAAYLAAAQAATAPAPAG
jgi:predicted ATPase